MKKLKSCTRKNYNHYDFSSNLESIIYSLRIGDKMKCNVGNTDRLLRIIIGLVILVLGYIYSSWWGLIGLIPLLTGFFRWCPVYLPCKINTDKSEK